MSEQNIKKLFCNDELHTSRTFTFLFALTYYVTFNIDITIKNENILNL